MTKKPITTLNMVMLRRGLEHDNLGQPWLLSYVDVSMALTKVDIVLPIWQAVELWQKTKEK